MTGDEILMYPIGSLPALALTGDLADAQLAVALASGLVGAARQAIALREDAARQAAAPPPVEPAPPKRRHRRVRGLPPVDPALAAMADTAQVTMFDDALAASAAESER